MLFTLYHEKRKNTNYDYSTRYISRDNFNYLKTYLGGFTMIDKAIKQIEELFNSFEIPIDYIPYKRYNNKCKEDIQV